MKKLMVCLAALIMTSGMVKAQTVTVADVEALPGETVSFSVSMSGGKANTYTALGFDIQFPSNSFTTTGDFAISNLWSKATGAVGEVNASGLATAGFYSEETMTGSDINDLVTVEFTVGSGVALGDYDVTLVNPTFEYGTTGADVADDITFKVNVVERHTVILDELATVVPTAVQNVDVTVKRTIKANEWSTICLPFAMTAEQVKTAFGDDVKLNDFEGIETDYEGKNIVGIQVKFNTATAIEENHPYLIKVSSLINEFSVNNVSINPVTKPTVDKDELYFKGVYFYNSFVGTYVAETIVPKNNLFLSNNKFWYSTGSTQMKAFRGYFDFMDILSDVENASTRIGFNFDETTGIKEVHGNANVEGTYDLQGRKVEEPTNKGLYIVNGRKVVKK